MERAAFIGAVLFSVAQWLKPGTVTVRTKALIIHFPLEKSLCAKTTDGPSIG